MNRLKSIFITLFVNYLAIVLIIATYWLLSEPFSWGWLGVEISVFFPFLYYILSYVQPRPRTGKLWMVSYLILLGFILTMLPAFIHTWEPDKTTVWLAALTYIFWFLYETWYSSLGRIASEHIREGQILPEFSLQTLDHKPFDSSQLKGHRSLLLFYPGNWSTHSMAQIKELSGYYDELQKRGVDVYIISPQPHGLSQKLSSKYEAPFHFLTDPGNKAARKLGILHKSGTPAGLHLFGYHSDTVYPTLIITDEKGEILFTHETNNFRYRPDPRIYLKVLDKLAAS